MLVNAAIIRLDLPAPPTTGGDQQFTAGAAVSVPCVVDQPSFRQQQVIDQSSIDATAVLTARNGDLLAAGITAVPVNAIVAVRDRAGVGTEYQVRKISPRVKGSSLDHVEAFLRAR